uniref:BLTX177 n=1 Tax=Nephila pilipes TaxID=299642 RepID=A0A076KUD6_NEPPI|nr:BLTX177 [Nephila pilipes]
MNCIRTVFT